ncbi:glycosyltransferase family 4 protein [Candidatus Microgenomates bacterium]|nr:glycosyltransferase family 4 protein [Candidatus Microgenomates bacterium]
MRIGIDGRLWNETGVGRYIRSLFKYLPELDQENEYVWFLGKQEFDTLEMPNSKWRKVETNIHWHTLAEQVYLPQVFNRENLDLLHFPYFSFPIFYPKKFVVTIHDLIFDHYKTGKASTLPYWFYLIKRLGYHVVLWIATRRARTIFTLSNDAKSEIVDHYSVDPNKIVVTYESGEIDDIRKKFTGSQFNQMKKLAPYILYVGNVHPHKNVESLVLAMKDIPNFKLVLVGSDKFFYPKIEEFVKKQNLQDKVEIIGAVDNNQIGAWYYFASASVTASRMEGFGIPPLEAMNLGCPVIVSDIPVFHEVYGEAATFFNQNDPADIAKVIKETLSNKKLLAQKIRLGYKRAASFSWKKMVQETLSTYNKVANE